MEDLHQLVAGDAERGGEHWDALVDDGCHLLAKVLAERAGQRLRREAKFDAVGASHAMAVSISLRSTAKG